MTTTLSVAAHGLAIDDDPSIRQMIGDYLNYNEVAGDRSGQRCGSQYS